MLLVGSKALNFYININRIIHDWDLFMSNEEYRVFESKYNKFKIKSTHHSHLYEIQNEIYEIKTEIQFEPTDKMIFNEKHIVATNIPLGYNVFVPNIQLIYDMKVATALYIEEPKHKYDQKLIENNFPIVKNTLLFNLRKNETNERVSKSKKIKYDFFHKYHIPEYIEHDYLHIVIADLIGKKLPMYLKITTADTDISEELFNKLTYDEKLSLMAEESLVLALERWFIPQMVENGINYNLISLFDNNNEGLPTYKILKHCCITGLKGEAEYITNFAKANFFEIEKLWIEYKKMIKQKNGFPAEFYDKLFKIRNDFKAGKNVATI